jgi:DNA-directed RNA polymerase specialized sigma24 family protein
MDEPEADQQARDHAPERHERHLAELAERACAGDEGAWQALWAWLDPRLGAIVRKLRLPRISHEEDDRRAVVLAVMARLREDEFRRLRLFLESRQRDPQLGLMPWLKVVTRRVAIDCLRAHPSYLPGRGEQPGTWRDPQSLPPPSALPGTAPAPTRDGTAREMLAHAQAVLPADHYQALQLKIRGDSPAEIAGALGLSGPAQAERIVRAAFERLRRKFRTTLSGGPR